MWKHIGALAFRTGTGGVVRHGDSGLLSAFHGLLVLAVALVPRVCGDACAQEGPGKPVADAFEVMSGADRCGSLSLWPGFDPRDIPVAIFDGADTYLFRHPAPPEGFAPSLDRSDVHRFDGQFPAVRGNSRVRINDVWTATSVLSARSRRTGDEYTVRDLAGIVVHEQFHVFQSLRHPDWRPNDGLLLVYPPETVESLYLRRAEKEAFKRAVIAEDRTIAAGWTKEGLRFRERRAALLDPSFMTYEKELQRFEGISDYIETTARGIDPLHSSSMTNGIAPAGIRDVGYVEGRWLALLLDGFDPEWKSKMESGEAKYLEDLIAPAVNRIPSDASFTEEETTALRSDAERDFRAWLEEKARLLDEFSAAPGTTIEIVAEAAPLAVRMFEPLEMETYGGGRILHKVFFSAGNDKGSIRVLNHPCVTEMNAALGITRVTIRGLADQPVLDEKEKTFRSNSGGISVDLKYSGVERGEKRFVVRL